MQENNLTLVNLRVGVLPIINHFYKRLGLDGILARYISSERYVMAIGTMVKNIACEHVALYRIKGWAADFAPELLGSSDLSDDICGRALDRLFKIDRPCLQTDFVVSVIRRFGIKTERLHNDSTTLKLTGNYKRQNKKAVQLKRGHSKDHRPDLKQVLYCLTTSSDGAVPIHFKTYDGNVTDDTTHIETWLTLRSLLNRSDFLYVADCKLCTEKNMNKIDREGGLFITVVPSTRSETKTFAQKVWEADVRWERILKKRCSRREGRYDVFECAAGLHQLREGYKIYWYRSSEKAERDKENREERITNALNDLYALRAGKKRGPKTEKGLLRSCERILEKHRTGDWINVEISIRDEDKFTKTTRGKASRESTYTKSIKHVPNLKINKNMDNIAQSEALDGIFPLTTNSKLKPVEVLQSYKYQPNLEKRFNLLKSIFGAAPVFLKKNDRIEALLFIYFIAQTLTALIEREIRREMKKMGLAAIKTLPEERESKSPTWDQLRRLFEHHNQHQLMDGKKFVKTFKDNMTETQLEVLSLLKIESSHYL